MERESNPALGIFWMVVTGFGFVAVTALVKYVGSSLPSAQAGFMRYALGLVFLIPMLGAMRRAVLSRNDIGIFVVRGAFHTLGVLMWFYGMTQIPIAEVTAMNYMAPIYVTLGAAFFLGERIALRRLAAVAAAMCGALIILRPGMREVETGHIAMIFSAIAMGGSYLVMKRLSDKFDASVVVFMLSIFVTVGLAPFAIAVWVPPTLEQTLLMFAVAFFATVSHYTMTLAFRAAPLSVTQPVTFLQLIWATALGVFVFAEPVDIWVIMGGTIIIAAVSFITWREAMLKRKTVAPPHVATKL